MEYRTLGKTGLRASVIGIGVEHLKDVPAEEIEEILRMALREGVNYIDLVWALPNIVDGLSAALENEEEKPIIAFHLGSCIVNGKYTRSRDPDKCETHLMNQLELLDMDCAPVANIHYVPGLKAWREVERRGLLALAGRLKNEGMARAVSVSTHDPEILMLAAESGVEVVMYQLNAANHGFDLRDRALESCRRLGVGVVAMKPFAGGELLKAGKRVRIPAYKTGWKMIDMRIPSSVTPVNLLSYTLSQPGVCTAVTGVSSTRELASDLAYLKASEEDRHHAFVVQGLPQA
jgi:hypothetical protein